MKYVGKLYGKVGGKTFDTGKTSEDWDAMESQLSAATKENERLREALNDIINCHGLYIGREVKQIAHAALTTNNEQNNLK